MREGEFMASVIRGKARLNRSSDSYWSTRLLWRSNLDLPQSRRRARPGAWRAGLSPVRMQPAA